ncbi:MAG: lipocalin-like domain-containing protein [Candidatus Latescibacterota bacterium]|jgi:hypothetical protein
MRYLGFSLGIFAVPALLGCGDPDPVSTVTDPAGKLVVAGEKAGGYKGKTSLERAFVGTWQLVSFEGRPEGGGALIYPLGPDAIGQLRYDDAGNMGVFLGQRNRPQFVSGDRRAGTDAEVRAAYEGIVTYFGKYTIDQVNGTVTHHVVGADYPNWEGGEQVRWYQLEPGRLSLLTPPMLVHGQMTVYALVFERVN